MRVLTLVISCLSAAIIRAAPGGRLNVDWSLSVDKGSSSSEDYDYDNDDDYEFDDCDFSNYDGTCDNFHPTEDCFFTEPEYIKEEQCEFKAKAKCVAYTDPQFKSKECRDNCYDFHVECCCPAETQEPTRTPTASPSTLPPTNRPTPTRKPTLSPTSTPTLVPTGVPTISPTISLMPVTETPTREPWDRPTEDPTNMPASPTPGPTSECYNPETDSTYYFSMIGSTETCTDFFHGFPKDESCLFDAQFLRTDRCLLLPAVRCREEMAKNEYNYENKECFNECVKFHTICCCGDEVA